MSLNSLVKNQIPKQRNLVHLTIGSAYATSKSSFVSVIYSPAFPEPRKSNQIMNQLETHQELNMNLPATKLAT